MKPYAASRGRGIKIFSNLDDIVAEVNKDPEKLSYVQQQIAKRVKKRKVRKVVGSGSVNYARAHMRMSGLHLFVVASQR